MRIAVDARALLGERTGVGRYLEGLFGAWGNLFPADEIFLLSPKAFQAPTPFGRVLAPRRSSTPSLPGTIWLQTTAPRVAQRAHADLFFGPLGILPLLSRLPGVATVHDLTPLLFPEWHRLRNRLGFNPFIGRTVKRARGLVAVSESTRRDLVRLFPDAGAKCAVAHNGVEISTEPPGGLAPNEGRPYVLTLGTLEPRKNVARIVQAMELIWDRRPSFPELVLAGAEGWGMSSFSAQLASSRHGARIRRAGYVDSAQRTLLLQGARFLAYPSLYEGFGLPLLEAMAEGTPVVASSSSSLPEVAGDVGLLPDPFDVPAIAAAFERAEDDEAWREQARRKGPERASHFTWEASAKAHRALFEKALS